MFYRFAPGPGWGIGGWLIGLFGFVFWVLVIGLIISLILRHSHYHQGYRRFGERFGDKADTSETALEIAEKRYAKGEITKDEFAQIKKDLTKV